MTHPANEGFIDNWAYLKTELGWLDRMLMMALARYRQENKSVNRVAQSQADKVSSHWWKGVISLDGNIAYDEHRPAASIGNGKNPQAEGTGHKATGQPVNPPIKLSYQQQLDLRIQASKRNGVTLALPWLCDRLNLSLFEKNLLVMGLAPEVNRRYARLYRYLQSQDDHLITDLPSVELVLRLLCRNDQEWRRARQQLSPDSALITHGLVLLMYQPQDPFLNATIRLADELVDCLLAEDPDPNELEALLLTDESATDPQPWSMPELLPVDFSSQLSEGGRTSALLARSNGNTPTADITSQTDSDNNDIDGDGIVADDTMVADDNAAIVDVNVDVNNEPEEEGDRPSSPLLAHTSAQHSGEKVPTWESLILPSSLVQDLQHLSQRLRLYDTVNQYWAKSLPPLGTVAPGLVLLFAGPPGTGKKLAAQMLAHDLTVSFTCIDLAEMAQTEQEHLMDGQNSSTPSVVLIQSAEQWLRQSASIPAAHLTRWLRQRRQHRGLTILSVERIESVAPRWTQQLDHTFDFPLPDKAARQIFWSQAFPSKLKLGRTIDWVGLSHIPLTGEAINAIAHDAMIRMVGDGAKTLKLQYLVEALHWHTVPDCLVQKWLHGSRPLRSGTAKSRSESQGRSKSRRKSVRSAQGVSPTNDTASMPSPANRHHTSDTSSPDDRPLPSVHQHSHHESAPAPSKPVTESSQMNATDRS